MKAKEFRSRLLGWYGGQKRDLPWRKNADPYRVLVSELMLQQTQVKTVIPYYEKFLRLFPDAAGLARASEEKVLAAWAGLGYYRRARFLHAAAKAVKAAGRFPSDIQGLRALPGVGAYTAAAVGSISFGLAEPVIDGNVVRVISRLLAMEEDPTKKAGKRKIEEAARELMDAGNPGDYNQAMMELGALVCSPASPDCGACPVSAYCAARRGGEPERFPNLPRPKAAVEIRKAAALVWKGKSLLMAPAESRQGAPGEFKGFWRFPEGGDAGAALKSALKGRAEELGRAGSLRHSVTHHRIRVEAWAYRALGDAKAPFQWMEVSRVRKLPLASAEKRLLKMAEKLK